MRITPIVILCLCTGSAFAADAARQIDFSANVSGLDGKPYAECSQASEDGKRCLKTDVLTLGKLSAAALSIPVQRGETPVPLTDQISRGKLAARLIDAKSEALSSQDVTLIKEQIGKAGLPPVVVFHAVEMLDPAAAK